MNVVVTPEELLRDRLRHWREKLTMVDAALAEAMPALTRQTWRGYLGFLYREQSVCRAVVSELERISTEWPQP